MAGITTAINLIKQKKHKGTLEKFNINSKMNKLNEVEVKYRVDKKDVVHLLDYGSDIRIAKNLKIGDKVELFKDGEYEAMLRREDEPIFNEEKHLRK